MSYIQHGNRRIYDNFAGGCAAAESDPTDKNIYLTFHDRDNDELHMFAFEPNMIEQYINLVKQTAAGAKIEIVPARDMPKGGPRPA